MSEVSDRLVERMRDVAYDLDSGFNPRTILEAADLLIQAARTIELYVDLVEEHRKDVHTSLLQAQENVANILKSFFTDPNKEE